MTKQYFTKDEVIALARKVGYGKTITSKKLRKFAIESQLDALHTLCEEAARIIMERALVMWSKEVEELQVRNQKLAEALGKFTKFQEEAAAALTPRGEFEAEYARLYPVSVSMKLDKFKMDSFGDYEDTTVNVAWQLWLAAKQMLTAADKAGGDEPVAWRWPVKKLRGVEWRYSLRKTHQESEPLFTRPQTNGVTE